MAATPPTPPGANNFQLNGNSTQQQERELNNSSNNNTPSIAEALQQHFHYKALLNNEEQLQQQQQQQHVNNNSYEQLELDAKETEIRPRSKLSCQCTNISIMHLFHEMKQEFPTLPDALVTQCVNENCHQRDNCIQMLKKELILNPIPVQSYPAKSLQQQRQAKPPTPLKPSRVAPSQPPTPTTTPTSPLQSNGSVDTPPVPPARPRPTTLNLQRHLNAQLQQKIQQRQQQQQPMQLMPTAQYKPLRRAPPLPPLPPKPQTAAVSLAQQQQQQLSSFSNDSSCLTSPLSSSESEFSLNVSLSSPTAATATATSAATASTTAQLRSPVRHRSVITLQPEPPYAREFLSNAVAVATTPLTPPSPTSASGASTPGAGGRKSFTSLNLTLRQPQQTAGGAAPSTIDITAGPLASSGSGSGNGITYSSSSFDARRGTHKNFQLTVTDEGSVFSAGCVRPQVPLYAPCPPPPVLSTDGATPPPSSFVQQQQQQQHQQTSTSASEMPEVFPYPTQAQNHIVASNYNNNHLHSSNNNNSSDNSPSVTHMPLYEGVVPECDREAHAETIVRQKTRRDKLANLLRDNKKRLLSLEQEINILTEPVPLGESERLDRDIKKLTEDCQKLLNMINDPQLNGTAPAAPNSMNRQLSAPASNCSPAARGSRPTRSQVPPNSLRLNSVPTPATQSHLDFVQHHSSAPSSACLTPQQQQQQLQMQMQEPPPTYAQYYQFQQFLQHQRAAAAAAAAAAAMSSAPAMPQQQNRTHVPEEEEESLSESEVDESDEPLDMWACNLCTFQNHPQLNVCEACENVRIQPGMIRIVPNGDNNAIATATPTTSAAPASAAGAGLETDANRQQPYALHT